jgi:hypothetical protein
MKQIYPIYKICPVVEWIENQLQNVVGEEDRGNDYWVEYE